VIAWLNLAAFMTLSLSLDGIGIYNNAFIISLSIYSLTIEYHDSVAALSRAVSGARTRTARSCLEAAELNKPIFSPFSS